MCSVIWCESKRCNEQRFKLPEDPERRLEWVQFLAEVNGQRFKESSWTDITICSQHFTNGSFKNLSPAGPVQLKPGAVPTLCVSFLPDEPEPNLVEFKCENDQLHESPARLGWTIEETADTAEVSFEWDLPETCDSPISCSEDSSISIAAQESPSPSGVSRSTDTSDAFMSDYAQMLQKVVNIDIIRKKAALLHMKGRYAINEKRLLQLFSSKCPSCGGKLKITKVTHGVLIVLNQKCLQCEYRNQWTSQVKTRIPKAVRQHLTGGIEVTPEARQEVSTDDNRCSITVVTENADEESDRMEETDSSEEGHTDSDDEWSPGEELSLPEELHNESDEETKYDVEDYALLAPTHSRLCTDCGRFFSRWKRHMCEHKMKPYSCNICGKRCVSEIALSNHSRIHEDNYEYLCKYCHVTFKTKADKMTHEQTHLTQGKPYKCPDCSESFATIKERRAHMEVHRGPKQLKCNICGLEFTQQLTLKRHLVVHTGVKPFKCSVCQRGFNQAGHLKSHLRLHTGERPYKCQHCDKCFNHNVSLKSHVQRYHTSNLGRAQKKSNMDKKTSDTADAQERNKQVLQKKRNHFPKYRKRSTGRPVGRPKRESAGQMDSPTLILP